MKLILCLALVLAPRGAGAIGVPTDAARLDLGGQIEEQGVGNVERHPRGAEQTTYGPRAPRRASSRNLHPLVATSQDFPSRRASRASAQVPQGHSAPRAARRLRHRDVPAHAGHAGPDDRHARGRRFLRVADLRRGARVEGRPRGATCGAGEIFHGAQLRADDRDVRALDDLPHRRAPVAADILHRRALSDLLWHVRGGRGGGLADPH